MHGLRKALRAVGLLPGGPALSPAARIDGLDRAVIDPTARLTVLDADAAPASRIALGHGVFLGRNVELTAAGGGSVHIDDDTSIQDGSIIFGEVRIGAHCLFGKYVFVASRGHCFRDRPAWLIRDQDRLVLSAPASAAALAQSRVTIEEDCWIAQSVVVSPGVHIGRGAVIGANAVVTADVGPYEIHGGAPNRKIGTRLDFAPPAAIDARDDDALPYFYRGFRLTRDALAQSRKGGIAEARDQACIVLCAGPVARIRLTGINRDPSQALRLDFRVNGVASGSKTIPPGPFDVTLDPPAGPASASLPRTGLRQWTSIDIAAGQPMVPYGIATAAMVMAT